MTEGRTLQRVVLPFSPADDIAPLYATVTPHESSVTQATPRTAECIQSRRSLRVPARHRACFGSYFNAFPASYWRHWTTVDAVDLCVAVTGSAAISVLSSDFSGRTTVVDRREANAGTLQFHLPLDRFSDGGWCWFDVEAFADDVVVEEAEWRSVGSPDSVPSQVAVAITTLDRPSFVLELLRDLSREQGVLDALSRITVVDQGTQHVRDQPGFTEVADALGARLHIVDQANLGGSGGFARGMREATASAGSRYVLLLDDDVALEPESILRAQAFADSCQQPTIVGGQMLSLHDRSRLHTFGEVVSTQRYDWGPAPGVVEDHDFGVESLLSTAWMHRRIDVDYNGWWMCLIPMHVLQHAGLAAPYFIAWDDAEYGLRAGRLGYSTVTLPGMAVWHLPFAHKSDITDWKVYFNHRNRLITELTHHPDVNPLRGVSSSFREALRNLVMLQYSAGELRLAAVRDLLKGPDALHPSLSGKLQEVRALRERYTDGVLITDQDGLADLEDRGDGDPAQTAAELSSLAKVIRASEVLLRQLRRVPALGPGQPQGAFAPAHAGWHQLADHDNVLLRTSDGLGVRAYRRDRAAFWRLLIQHLRVHLKLFALWRRLGRQYGERMTALVTDDAWAESLRSHHQSVPGCPGVDS